jgi:hypothetical protein
VNTTAIEDLPFNYKAFSLMDETYSATAIGKVQDGLNYGFENQPDAELGIQWLSDDFGNSFYYDEHDDYHFIDSNGYEWF